MNPLIISAPFGNHLNFPGCTPTLGTFTLKPRGGLLYRLWRMAWTLRYDFRAGGWVNRLGLPNPGIRSLCGKDADGVIVSIHGFDLQEWMGLAREVKTLAIYSIPEAVELNLSCPNVKDSPDFMRGAAGCAVELLGFGIDVIAKLQPIRPLEVARPLWEVGVRTFHCCNTLPVKGGGLSGKPLKQLSLWAVQEMRRVFGGSVKLIGGGGVSQTADVSDYRCAGADYIAIGSMLLNPLNWRRIPDLLATAKGKSEA